MAALDELVAEGLSALRALSLSDLLEEAPARPRLPAALEEAVRARREQVLRECAADPELWREAAERLAGELRDLLHLRHQFLHVDAAREEALTELASSFVESALGALSSGAEGPELAQALGDVLATHRAELRSLILELLAECGSLGSGAPPVGESVCAEYSPGLQLEVLGAAAGELRAPILDLGCGPGAALVHYLRRAGHGPVLGLDRSAPASEGFLRLSWFERTLPRATFGTVVSHQAFSLHFLHAHHRSATRAAAFAAKYMEILRSLVPGGRFYYAPSLPFVEEHLDPAEFTVSRHRVGDTEFYAACVERRASVPA